MTVAVAALVVTVIATAVSVQQQAKAANKQEQALQDQAFAAAREAALQKELLAMEANDIRRAANDKADNIRNQARIIRGAQAVAAANSGFLVGEGTSQSILDQTSNLADQDVLSVLYDGINGFISKNIEGDFGLRAGNNRATSLLDQASAVRIGSQGKQVSTLSSGLSSGLSSIAAISAA